MQRLTNFLLFLLSIFILTGCSGLADTPVKVIISGNSISSNRTISFNSIIADELVSDDLNNDIDEIVNSVSENSISENSVSENSVSANNFEDVIKTDFSGLSVDIYSHNALGWKLNNGSYEFYDRITGHRITDATIDGIKINADGSISADNLTISKIDTMMKAHYILDSITNADDSMEIKREKAFKWILSFPYKRHRLLPGFFENNPGYEIVFANDIFELRCGDCVSESAALAFLFHEIGYSNVTFCQDTGHSWVDLDGKLYDPLFAEAKNYDANYNADYTDYRKRPPYSVPIY